MGRLIIIGIPKQKNNKIIKNIVNRRFYYEIKLLGYESRMDWTT